MVRDSEQLQSSAVVSQGREYAVDQDVGSMTSKKCTSLSIPDTSELHTTDKTGGTETSVAVSGF